MPIIAIILSSFVTLFAVKANAQVVIEPYSAALKQMSIRAHTSSIYGTPSGKLTRNLMLPRLMSEAVKKNPKVTVVVADEDAIKWFRSATAILEIERYMPRRDAEKADIQWSTRTTFKADAEEISTYWIMPFGNPERELDNANAKDVEWALETLESTLQRYLTLRQQGIKASIVLDIADGGLPASLGHWVLDNINVRVDKTKAIDVLLEAETSRGVMMGHHDDVNVDQLITPALLQKNFPELTKKFADMIQHYSSKINGDKAKSTECGKVLK